MNYKNTTIKVCTYCNSKKVKQCMKKYQGTFLDCTICQKAVMYNNTILCIGCSHWIHMKCTHLSSDDINEIEKLEIPWFCNTCTTDIFPFSQILKIHLQYIQQN